MVNQMGTNLTSTTLASTHTSFFLPTSSWSLSSTYISETFCLFDFGIDIGIDNRLRHRRTQVVFSPPWLWVFPPPADLWKRSSCYWLVQPVHLIAKKKTLLSNKYSSRPSPEVLSLFVPFFLCTSKKGVWLLAFEPEPAFLAQGVDAQTWFAGSSWSEFWSGKLNLSIFLEP